MSSARDIITRAFRLLGVFEASETPGPDDLAAGLSTLNEWISNLATQRASIFTVVPTAHPLTGSVASYTIGPGGDFNQVRPLWIDQVSVIPDRGAVPPIEVDISPMLTVQQYQQLPVKSTPSSYPTSAYYDYGFTGAGLGRITVYPVPTSSACDLVLYTPQPMGAFADLTTDYAFPPGYERMLRYNLALELAPEYDAVPSPTVLDVALSALADIKRANYRPADLQFDQALVGRSGRPFNCWTGQ